MQTPRDRSEPKGACVIGQETHLRSPGVRDTASGDTLALRDEEGSLNIAREMITWVQRTKIPRFGNKERPKMKDGIEISLSNREWK
jgi:hypothetical protein